MISMQAWCLEMGPYDMYNSYRSFSDRDLACKACPVCSAQVNNMHDEQTNKQCVCGFSMPENVLCSLKVV